MSSTTSTTMVNEPMPNEQMMSADVQTSNMSFIQGKKNGNVFYVRIRDGPMGTTPMAMVRGCSLPPIGKATDNRRGIRTFESSHGDVFSKLKLRFDESTASGVFDLCRKTLENWKNIYDPVRRSAWYQKTFNFSDGTKVHNATMGIETPELFGDFKFEGVDEFDAPSATFAPALYGGNGDPWYHACGIPTARPDSIDEKMINDSQLYLYDEAGKRIKSKTSDGVLVYPAGGIPLTDTAALEVLGKSTFFKEGRWVCRTTIQLTSITWKTSVDIVTGYRVLYPIFSIKTSGSIVMQKTVYELAEGVIPVDQRLSVLDSLLFEGMDAPPIKKRKRAVSKKAGSVGTVESDKDKEDAIAEPDVVPDSDIEGDQEN